VIELQDIVSQELGEEGTAEPAFELVEEPAEQRAAEAEPVAQAEPFDLDQVLPAEPVVEYSAAPETLPASHEFDLELRAPAKSKSAPEAATTEDFISELVAEIDGLEAPRPGAEVHAKASAEASPASLSKIFEQEPQPMKAVTLPHVPEPTNGNAAEPTGPHVTAESLNQLSEVFQEFRAELGELGEEDEDLETHYNLGIAYREMGLLDEAIGELQKACQSFDRGHPFPQIMQTYTWLAQCFLEKGVPEAAVRWYDRALQVPTIDGETRVALNYELASAYETAGDKPSALKHFMDVYGSNIDYRDVAERIKALKS